MLVIAGDNDSCSHHSTRHVPWALNTFKNSFSADARRKTHFWCIYSHAENVSMCLVAANVVLFPLNEIHKLN